MSLSRYLTTELTLTDSRILCKFGLVRSTKVDSALNKIDRVQIEKPCLGRILGYSTLIVTVSGSGRGRERFPQISAPARMAESIRDQATIFGKTPH